MGKFFLLVLLNYVWLSFFVLFSPNSILVCALSQGKLLKCSSSQTKNRLFIGNVPGNWVKDDLKKAVTKVGPGVINVDLVKVTTSLLSKSRAPHM